MLSSNTLSSSDAAHIKANVGWIKLKYLHKSSEAMTDFEDALNLDANIGSVYIGIAEYHMANKNYEDAYEYFNIVYQYDPRYKDVKKIIDELNSK